MPTPAELLEEVTKNDIVNELDEYRLFLGRLKDVFGTPQGMDILDWILDEVCGYHDSVFTGNSQTFYKSGKVDVAKFILAEVTKADPQIYHRLIDRWYDDANKAEQEERNG